MLPFDFLAPFEWLFGLDLGPFGASIGLGIFGAVFLGAGWSAMREARREDNDDRQSMFGCLGWGLIAIGVICLGKLLFDLVAIPLFLFLTLLFVEAAS